MEIESFTVFGSHKLLFKIDLIVWKCIPSCNSNHDAIMFKIDLIVWK